ncbi:hypothetical protein CGRA01v4_08006 [Colletotrichum graminicola]|nr:hypothetical protein CGRA01v4_08006 [Colletotrichum graminicola]
MACAASEASFTLPLNSRLDGKWACFPFGCVSRDGSSELAATRRGSMVNRATPRTALLVKYVSMGETPRLIARPNRAISLDPLELIWLASKCLQLHQERTLIDDFDWKKGRLIMGKSTTYVAVLVPRLERNISGCVSRIPGSSLVFYGRVLTPTL